MTERAAEPPRGPPWDEPLETAPFAFVDLELTGLQPKVDRILEVCIERVRGGRVEARVATLVRPDPPVMGNAHVHGIRAEEIESAPTFSALAGSVSDVLAGAIFVAHAAWHDIDFL